MSLPDATPTPEVSAADHPAPASQVPPRKRLNPAVLLPNHTTLYSMHSTLLPCKYRRTCGFMFILRISAVFYG